VIENNNGTLFNITPNGSCWCNNYIGNGSQLLITQNTNLQETVNQLNNTIQWLLNSIAVLQQKFNYNYTTAQRNNLTASNGMTIYNIDYNIMESYLNGTWQPLNHPTIILTANIPQAVPNSDTKILFDTISVNGNPNVFSVSNSIVTVLLSGVYLICGSVPYPGNSTYIANHIAHFIMVNGNRTLESTFAASSSLTTELYLTAHLYLQANTTIYAGIFQDTTVNIVIGFANVLQLQPKLSIELVSY